MQNPRHIGDTGFCIAWLSLNFSSRAVTVIPAPIAPPTA